MKRRQTEREAWNVGQVGSKGQEKEWGHGVECFHQSAVALNF